ncbi:MAG: sulfite exporter TauE/SafE family protein [Defluviicoccus sp.]|nr:sulfite exporter TauE/SafE family protein [Defluviicoccus sp.]
MDIDLALAATAAVAFTAAGIVKGVVGLGLPLTAIAVLTLAMGLREAVPLIIVPVLITNFWQMTRGGMLVPLVRRFWTMIAPLGVGAWLGTVLLFAIDETLVGALLGAVIIVYSLVNIFAIRFRVPAGHEAWYSPGVGLLSGLLTGLTGSVGGPVAIYFQALGLDRETFLQAASLAFFLTALPWGGTLVAQGALDFEAAAIGAAALPPSFAGMWIGQRIGARLSPEVFSKGVFGFLILVGANLIRRAIV